MGHGLSVQVPLLLLMLSRVGSFLFELEVVLKKECEKDGKYAKIVEQRKRVMEHDGREKNGENLSRGHHEREDERAELLDGHENEYLTDGAREREKHDVKRYVRVLAQERNRLAQLALIHQAHERVGRRVHVGEQHERDARHEVVAD